MFIGVLEFLYELTAYAPGLSYTFFEHDLLPRAFRGGVGFQDYDAAYKMTASYPPFSYVYSVFATSIEFSKSSVQEYMECNSNF